MYLYLATNPLNAEFHNRGVVQTAAEAFGYANQMAKHGQWVYVGRDVGPAVLRDNVRPSGLVRVLPTEEPDVILIRSSENGTRQELTPEPAKDTSWGVNRLRDLVRLVRDETTTPTIEYRDVPVIEYRDVKVVEYREVPVIEYVERAELTEVPVVIQAAIDEAVHTVVEAMHQLTIQLTTDPVVRERIVFRDPVPVVTRGWFARLTDWLMGR